MRFNLDLPANFMPVLGWGLLPEPARGQPGVKSALPPLTDFMKLNMEACGRLRKFLDHHALVSLDYQATATLVEETRMQHDLHERARVRLGELRK